MDENIFHTVFIRDLQNIYLIFNYVTIFHTFL